MAQPRGFMWGQARFLTSGSGAGVKRVPGMNLEEESRIIEHLCHTGGVKLPVIKVQGPFVLLFCHYC